MRSGFMPVERWRSRAACLRALVMSVGTALALERPVRALG
jgi:hypothetical protein